MIKNNFSKILLSVGSTEIGLKLAGSNVWKDKREIMALSNKYNAEFIETRNRRGQVKCKPNMIAQYTKHMKSVDHHDQMMAYYSCEHKSLIWYKKVIIHLLEIMIINAYLLYRADIRHNITLYDFKLSVIKSLLSYDFELSLPLTSRVHLPSNLPKDDRDHTKRRRCAQCWKVAKKRVQSIFFCNDCLEKPGLCIGCFREYHRY
ncbi:unnamed protein product [Parnassius mnemosyne]|uniref:PiggyBac transposable element-derived protein domain-containing protein n=1 Tax=Parnassius mnemosyne TaxID=213953 RepID=A0AAV1KJU4_9NEOP